MKNIYFLWCGSLLILLFCGCHKHIHPDKIKPAASSKVKIQDFIDANVWDTLFPYRYRYSKDSAGKTDFYSFVYFADAAKHFPQFLSVGDDIVKRRELAAFLATIAYETNDEKDTSSTDYLYRGLALLISDTTGINENQNNDTTLSSKFLKNKFYPRGPIQLKGANEYQQFGHSWFENDSILLLNPDELITNAETSFASAIWWWTTAHGTAPSCHDVITGNWEPTMADVTQGRFAGYGTVVNILTGGLKCGMGYDDITNLRRYELYKRFCEILRTLPGEDISCKEEQPFN